MLMSCGERECDKETMEETKRSIEIQNVGRGMKVGKSDIMLEFLAFILRAMRNP